MGTLWERAVRAQYKVSSRLMPYSWHFEIQRMFDFPTYRKRQARIGYRANLSAPTTFNEKLAHRHLFGRDPIWITTTDKLAVREWIAARQPEDLHLIPLLGVYEHAGDIDFHTLPSAFALKVNFASGYNVLVHDKAKEDLEAVRAELDAWMHGRQGYRNLVWPPQHIPRRIVAEPLLLTSDGSIPLDFKFFVIHGRTELIQVDQERYSAHSRTMYSRDWTLLDLTYHKPRGRVTPPDPNLPSMLKIAEELGQSFDFVRVDLYSVGDKVYFGELTRTPEGGMGRFDPVEWDLRLGEYWRYGSGISSSVEGRTRV